jgi:hypothetical protein
MLNETFPGRSKIGGKAVDWLDKVSDEQYLG